MIYGVDGASWQGLIDCAKLRQEGHDFLIEKVTGEGNYVNPVWSQNRDNARAAGLIFGTYDWVEPQSWQYSGESGIAGARDYLAVIGERQVGELLCVDFETPDWATGPLGRNIEGAFRAYIHTLFLANDSRKIILYTGKYFLDETGASGWAWLPTMCELWQAAPGAGMMADDSFWPATPAPFGETLIHQHQWYATSGAIHGQYDRDRFRGTREELMAYGKPAPQVTAETVSPAEDIAAGIVGAGAEAITTGIDNGNPWVKIAFGGHAAQIAGVNSVDVGISVLGDDGATYDRSVQHNVFGEWIKRSK